MNDEDRLKLLKAVKEACHPSHPYSCSHRRLERLLGIDTARLLADGRKHGLVVSKGRGRNRNHSITEKGRQSIR